MAARGFAWPQNFVFQNEKMHIFVNHWRSAKVGTIQIYNGQVRVLFHFSDVLVILGYELRSAYSLNI